MYKDKAVDLDYILDNYLVLHNLQQQNKDTKQEFINLIREFYIQNPVVTDELQFKEHNGWAYLGSSMYLDTNMYSNDLSKEIATKFEESQSIEMLTNEDTKDVIAAYKDISSKVPEIVISYVLAYGSKGMLIGVEKNNSEEIISFYVRARQE
ncbi:MAG: hypothetical protein ACOCQQ_02180 [Candidatus Nanoarchaeia archaeon]